MFLIKFLEYILQLFYGLTSSYGLSIILLSLTVTIIMLPLFWIAEKLQNKERARKAKMQPALDKLKDITNKQEKYYYTRRIYKQYNYSPFYSLTGLLGLLIQIPFFLAAYWMLLEYTPLEGASFGPIKDLFQPDGLILFGGMSINLLPFVMTIINLLGGYLYTKNTDKSERIQLIVMAFVFLVLLYNMSAALVLYWTMNNVFAIGKNWLLNKLFKNRNNKNLTQQVKMSTWLYATFDRIDIRNVVMPMSLIAIYLFLVSTLKGKVLGDNIYTQYGYFLFILICGALVLLTIFYLLRLNTKNIVLKILALLTVSVTYLLSLYLLTYKTRVTYLVILAFIIILILIFTINKVFSYKKMIVKDSETINVELKDLIISWLLLPPLISYHLTNNDYFDPLTVLLYYVILFLMPLITLIIIYYYAHFLNRKLVIITIISLILTTYLMPVVTNIFKSTAETNIFINICAFFVVYSIIMSYSYGKKLTAFVFAFIIAIISIQQLNKTEFRLLNAPHNNTDISDVAINTSLNDYLFDTEMKYKPDIYFLVYESYVSSKLMNHYNINNYELTEFLQKSGFMVYNNTYSNNGDTRTSMAGVLNMGQNIGLTRRKLNELISGNSTVDNILQNNGYHTNYILSSYLLKGDHNFGGDYAFPNESQIISPITYLKTIIQCIFLGEFIWDLEFANNDINTWEKAEKDIFRLQLDNPKFLYSHYPFPGHSQSSGKLLQRDFDNYIKNLNKANNKIKDDVKEFLLSENEAVIIIAGDHGPSLTGDGAGLFGYNEKEISGLNIIDRYGTFLAIKYPDRINRANNNDIMLLQNVFVHIFSDLFDDDEILKYKLPPTTFRGDGVIAKGPIPNGVIKNGQIMYGKDKGKTVEDILNEEANGNNGVSIK